MQGYAAAYARQAMAYIGQIIGYKAQWEEDGKRYMEKRNPGGYMFSNADLRRLIFPLIVEQILAVSVGMVDTMMVSSVGEAATSGVSLVDMVNTLFINIFAAVATGGAVVSSQYLGQKRQDRACQSADQLLIITGILSLAIMAVCIVFRREFLSLLYRGVAEDVMRNARTYLVISAVSYPFLSVYYSCAALASLISRMAACFILLLRLRNRNLDIHIGTSLKMNRRMVRQILHIGIPNGIENSIFQLGRVLVVGIIAMFGTTQIAANAIANNLDGMGVLPGQAMSLAIITVVGRCVGAGDFKQADYYARKMMKATYLISGLCCIAVILTMPFTLKLYGLSQEARRLGGILVLIHNGCAILIWPASFCLANVLRAANDVKFPMCVSIGSMVVFRIGFSFLLAAGLGMGAVGVWWAMIADWVVRSSFFAWRFFGGKWKTFYVRG